MDSTVTTAIFSAISAIIGGSLTAVVSPYIQHKLNEAPARRKEQQEQIVKWRQMILDVHRREIGDMNPSKCFQVHPDYISLEPFLTADARHIAKGENRTMVVGQTLSHPLETLKNEIARIEESWGLRK